MVDAYSGTAADTARIPLVDFDNPANKRDSLYGSAAPLDLEGLIAPGDSGGGLFVGDRAEAPLVGVASYIRGFDWKNDSDYGDTAAFTRISAFNSWIDEMIQSHPGLMGTGDPLSPDGRRRKHSGARLAGPSRLRPRRASGEAEEIGRPGQG